MTDIRLTQLDLGQWAWEFLRRNPDYQADYREFIAIWRALEAEYGAPPNRDFFNWSSDPRASRPAWDPEHMTGAACTTDDEDRQLIECWMGAKWGFYQFPQDPALAAWELESPINWRPAPGFRFDRPVESATDAQLVFDLTLPLSTQMEAARQWLISKQAALKRQGLAIPRTLQNQQAHWMKLLKALDANSGELLEEAREMTRTGYREILHLRSKPQTA
ncbi:MAG: hypothetical protein HXY27_05005 [Hydrogenophilaceae bacterium]|nr:hypothetical protein [Hydrogenophilaceae bacterium]